MSQELGERHSQHSEETRLRRHRVLALIGGFLLVIGLGSWGITVFTYLRNIPGGGIIRSNILKNGLGDGGLGCFDVSQNQLIFTVLEGQSVTQTVKLVASGACPSTDIWSATIETDQGIHWLSISPTQGYSNKTQTISIIVSSSALTKGIHTASIIFTPKLGLAVGIEVIAQFMQNKQQTSLIDTVAFTHIGDLTIMGEWPHFVKGQSASITISLLSSKNLPRNLPSAATPTTRQIEEMPTLTVGSHLDIPFGDDYNSLLESGYGSGFTLTSLAAKLNGAAFDIPSHSPSQGPYQKIVTFHWNILPKESGSQSLEVVIAGKWQHQGGGDAVTGTFLDGDFGVNVDDSPLQLVTFGQVNIMEIGVTFGAALGAPLLLDRIHESKKAKKKVDTTSTSSQSTTLRSSRKSKGGSYKGSHRRN